MFLIKGATIYTEKGEKQLDLRVREDRIFEIGHHLEHEGDEQVIDGVGKYLLPGAIDPHVHFRDPGHPQKEDFETGGAAALAGGVTTVFDMPNTSPPVIDFESLEIKRAAARKAKCNVRFFVGATPDNLDLIPELIKEPDVVGVKAYLGSSTGNLLFDDEELWGKLFSIPGLQVVVHAEKEAIIKANAEAFKAIHDPEIHSVIRSNDAAEAAVRRACEVGFKHNTRLHIAHMSTREELVVIKEYKEKGYSNLTCEVCPHHLWFTTADYHDHGNYMKVNPPVRSKEDRNSLWEDGIALGLVDIFATDHAPHTKAEKEKVYEEAPSGMPGVQEATSLFLNKVSEGELSLKQFVEMRSTRVAEIFGLKERGVIKEGYFADLMLVDLGAEQEIALEWLKSKCGWSNYEGMKLKGKVEKVWCGGELIVNY